MSCNIPEELIYQYIEGELDELTALVIKEHLNVCDRCRITASDIKQLLYEINVIKDEEIQYPDELDSICEKVYMECDNEKRFGLKNFIFIQKNVLKSQENYIKYIPGTKLIKSTTAMLGKGTKKVFGMALKQGYKMAFTRS